MKREFQHSLWDEITYEPGELGEGDPGGTKVEPHIHTKHEACMFITAPAKDGGGINKIQVHFCSGCHLVWFEDLGVESILLARTGAQLRR